jgi:hypothetical protein
MVAEQHSLAGKPVDVRSAELCLTVAAKITVAQIISKYVDNIGQLAVSVRLAAG